MSKPKRSYGKGSVRERRPGHWQLRYDGQSKMAAVRTQRQAEDELAKWKTEMDDTPPLSLSMNDLFDDYRAEYLRKQNTDIEHVDHRLKHLRPAIGGMDPRLFKQRDMDRYAAARLQELTHLGTLTSVSTINREIAVVSASMRLAAEELHRIVRFKKYPEEKFIRQGLVSPELYRQMLYELADHVKPFWVLSYYTGVRKGELLLLRWDWLDWEQWLIRVPPFFQGERITKNGKPHLILLYCAEMRETIKFAWQRRDPANPCLFQRNGECVKSFRTAFEEARRRCSQPDLIFHDLRRTAARNMRRHGISEEVAMKIGGWCTPAIFRRYRILDEMELVEAGQHLARVIDGSAEKYLSTTFGPELARDEPSHPSGPDLSNEPKLKQ
jgi:integrase